ncbi:MAG: glutamine--tRNA ligase/YqeY domain fusion protein [Planctomycetota bacterium]
MSDGTPDSPAATDAAGKPTHFIAEKIEADLAAGKFDGATEIVTRFPPEPNGFLHVGHAKSICLNFGLPQAFGGRCNLRFDDTNPAKEEQRYIDAIKQDVRWLGFEWAEERYASDYFDTLYDWACKLIEAGHAFVDDQSGDEIRATRGDLVTPGRPSPFRDRPADESLDLFARMKAGEFPDGGKVVRARIDMASPNLNLRDPVLYRILHAEHPRTGNAWCVYPMYDWAHGQSDWIEGVTHSLCSLEFEDHRPLYDWCLDTLIGLGVTSPSGVTYRPEQTEFNRLNLTHTQLSKRKLRALVDEGVVDGWDDPRMPTLAGMRRRGFTPAGLRSFVEGAGLSKRNQTMELARLESSVREDLNRIAQRRMAVLDPIKLVIDNWPAGHVEMRDAPNNPENDADGSRQVPMTGELFIARGDFMVDPPKKFFRLGPGREVRLRFGYFVTCTGHEIDDAGNVTVVRCTYDPATSGGSAPDGRKVKGTLTWVSVEHALDAAVREYQTLFATEDPDEGARGGNPRDWHANLNPDSLRETSGAKLEPACADASPGQHLQFERIGYFVRDAATPTDGLGRPVFNATVGLRDTWGKQQKKGG